MSIKKYKWYNLPNNIKKYLYLDPQQYSCIDNVEGYNKVLAQINWSNMMDTVDDLRVIVGIQKKRGWFNLTGRIQDVIDYIDSVNC